jgi:hypothetical protein
LQVKLNGKLQPWQYLAWYLRMLRNCLVNKNFNQEYILPDPGQLIAKFNVADMDLLESCPLAPSWWRIADVVGLIKRRYLSHGQSANGSSQGRNSMCTSTIKS